jgi:hypothetical protein
MKEFHRVTTWFLCFLAPTTINLFPYTSNEWTEIFPTADNVMGQPQSVWWCDNKGSGWPLHAGMHDSKT